MEPLWFCSTCVDRDIQLVCGWHFVIMCIVCGIASSTERCRACHEVFVFVNQLTVPERDHYVLVVDGSFGDDKCAGAGMVLARESDEVTVAWCAASYKSSSSNHAELEAIRRGLLWAPLNVCWSDSKEMIKYANRIGLSAKHIPHHLRDPLHNFAHRLANIGRMNQWEKLDTIWAPGEVWP